MEGTLAVTGDPDADHLVNTDPLALLLGMLLDQQIPMERAFIAPLWLQARLGCRLDAAAIAAADPDAFAAIFRQQPALHRFPKSMAARVQAACAHVVAEHGNDAAAIWTAAADGADLRARLRAVPGYGDEKARIFIAILAKRLDIRPAGWEQAAGAFADDNPRSVADIDGPDSFARVRAWKQAQKAAKRTKSE